MRYCLPTACVPIIFWRRGLTLTLILVLTLTLTLTVPLLQGADIAAEKQVLYHTCT